VSDLRRTPLYANHQSLGARLVPFAGWEMPVQYTSIQEEHRAVRERVGLFDVSHMGQIHLSGPGAIEGAEELVTCVVASLGIDRARYGLMLNDSGGCIDDVMLTREAEDALFLCVNASNVEKADAWIREHAGPGVVVDNRSDETALLALQGPAARPLLERLLPPGTSAPKRFRVSRLAVSGIPVLVSATGYTGSPGFELYVGGEQAAALFDALMDAGQAEGILPAGLGARDTLRLEAGLSLYGHELDEGTSPIEAGLERFVKLEAGGFIGAEAIAQADRNPRRLVGLEMIGRGIARADYEIVHDGEVVGRVTSGAPSPTLGKSIALGYVPQPLSDIGRTLSIRIRTRDVEAQIVKLPFLS
jgi:glycine cleavage system T protein (aminomethyltransferase)